MEIYIALPNNYSSEQYTNALSYKNAIVYYENSSDIKQNSLVLDKDEIILKWPNLLPSKYVCVTNGTWIDKQKKFTFTTDKFSPIFLKNKNLKFPFFKNKKLQQLYDEYKYNEFTLETEKHIFDDIKNKNIILRYFLSIVYFFKLKNHKKSQQHINYILNIMPHFAEAWCLLGDIFVFSNMFLEARKQYENALAFGRARDIYDDLPICPKKYEDYPQSMIEKITQSFENAKVLSLDNI